MQPDLCTACEHAQSPVLELHSSLCLLNSRVMRLRSLDNSKAYFKSAKSSGCIQCQYLDRAVMEIDDCEHTILTV